MQIRIARWRQHYTPLNNSLGHWWSGDEYKTSIGSTLEVLWWDLLTWQRSDDKEVQRDPPFMIEDPHQFLLHLRRHISDILHLAQLRERSTTRHRTREALTNPWHHFILFHHRSTKKQPLLQRCDKSPFWINRSKCSPTCLTQIAETTISDMKSKTTM